MNEHLLHRSWAEINLDTIAANVRLIRSKVRRSSEILGVVKADAYGHGARQVVPVLLDNGVNRLAVSMLDEAIELRQAGIQIPILVLSYTDPNRAHEILKYKVTQTVYNRDLASALSNAAVERHEDARIHIKVDTGMGRVGFLAGYDAIKSISWIRDLPNMVVEGLYTHFATADEADDHYVWHQFEQFMSISQELDRIGLPIPLKHVCNSAAIMRFPQMHLDMVRPGLMMYGMIPPGCPDAWQALKPAMTLKSNLIHVKQLPAGSSVSYGRSFQAKRDSLIGTIPIGYADGYSRRLNQNASVLIRGRRVPVVGKICMDSCMVDLTDLKGEQPRVGEEVVLFGPGQFPRQLEPERARQEQKSEQDKRSQLVLQEQGAGPDSITVDQIAEWMGTINYEVTCIIGRRVPRAFIRHHELEYIHSYLFV